MIAKLLLWLKTKKLPTYILVIEIFGPVSFTRQLTFHSKSLEADFEHVPELFGQSQVPKLRVNYIE